MAKRSYGLFTYSTDGNDTHEVHPDPPSKKEAKPFHVIVRCRSWIPISYLVFARDAEHAWARVATALREVIEKYTYRSDHRCADDDPRTVRSAKRILAELASGELEKHVEPYDTYRLCCTVNWASNGGL